MKRLLTALLAVLWSVAPAAAVELGDVAGHSIVVDYQETVESPRFGTWTATAKIGVFISSQGQIFLRSNRHATDGFKTGKREAVSGEGEGRFTPFRWAGGGRLTREFVQRSGRIGQHVIEISGTKGAFACRMYYARDLNPRVIVTELRNQCRVSPGNIFGS